MGLRGSIVLSHAPWLWLYVTASLAAAANVMMLPHAWEFVGDGLGTLVAVFIVGFQFGQVSLAALWAAWGPATWVKNHTLAIGALLLMVFLSIAGIGKGTDRILHTIVLYETTTGVVFFTTLLIVFHFVRCFGGWRLLQRGIVAEDDRWQFSLRGVLVATALVAVALALLRWRGQFSQFPATQHTIAEIAQKTGWFSLLIGPLLIAPLFLFFAIIDRRRRVLHVALFASLGYPLPFFVFWLLANGNSDQMQRTAFPLAPVQCGVLATAGMGWVMFYAAGVRVAQLPQKSTKVQRTLVES